MTDAALTVPAYARYGHELHAFLENLPRALKKNRLDDLQRRCQKLLADGRELKRSLRRSTDTSGWVAPRVDAHPSDFPKSWSASFAQVHHTLSELQTSIDAARKAGHEARAYVLTRYEAVSQAYEHWRAIWREQRAEGREAFPGEAPAANSSLAIPRSLAPLIPARTIFHVAMALVGAGMYQFVLTQSQAVAVLVTLFAMFGTLEITRRIWPAWNAFLCRFVFKAIARPRELHQVNSATWYLLALCLLTPLFSKAAVIVALMVLGFGDPAAAWIGKRFGRFKLVGDKSLEGTLGFVAAGFVAAGVPLMLLYPVTVLQGGMAAISGALAGALAELFTRRMDDNFTVPVAAALAAALWL